MHRLPLLNKMYSDDFFLRFMYPLLHLPQIESDISTNRVWETQIESFLHRWSPIWLGTVVGGKTKIGIEAHSGFIRVREN